MTWEISHSGGWDGGIRNHDDGVKVRCLTTWLHPNLFVF